MVLVAVVLVDDGVALAARDHVAVALLGGHVALMTKLCPPSGPNEEPSEREQPLDAEVATDREPATVG